MTNHKAEVVVFIITVSLILIGAFAFAYFKAKYIYDGDMRCLIAECRITK